jgi:hypothetical protein
MSDSKKQWQAAQAQARRAQADPEQQPAGDGEPGRDWDEGDDAWQAREARAAETKAAKERAKDYERGSWSSDITSPVGITRYS